MIPWLSSLRAQADAIDPHLWFAAVAVLVGAAVFAWRKVAPSTWEKVPSRFKVLPAAIIGALLTAGAGDKASSIILHLVIGAFSGLTAAGGHEMGVRLLSGTGDARKKKEPKAKPAAKAKPAKAKPKAKSDGEAKPKQDEEDSEK